MHLPLNSYERGSRPDAPPPARMLVFVVEDEEDIARLIAHNLQAAGFDVQSFVSGASVVSEACGRCPRCFCWT